MKTNLLFVFLAPFVVATALSAAPATLAVDKQKSSVEYAVTATVDSFTGKLSDYDLTLAADPAVPGRITEAILRFRFADLSSGNNKRDRQMREWENTDQFADCTFTLVKLEPTATAGQFTAHGQFRLHGMTRDLVFPVSISTDAEGLHVIDGEARIDTREFGLPIIRKFGLLKVDPVVAVKLHIQARQGK